MKVTYLGHACFSAVVNGKTLIFDPFIRFNELAKNIDVAGLKADYVLLSHGHFDHVADAKEIIENNDSTLISNFEVGEWFEKQGVKKVHLMNHGGKWNFDFGSVKLTHAVHSSNLPDGSYGGNAVGFLVNGDKHFYYSGDTALTYDMKLIAEFEKPLDFALLPIGDNFTMGVEDAIRAADFINCKTIVALHFDTFGYIKINKDEATKKFAEHGKRLIILNIGESIDL